MWRASLLVVVIAACSFRVSGSVGGDATGDALVEAPIDAAIDARGIDASGIDACSTCPANDVPGGAIQITGTATLLGNLVAAHDDQALTCGMTGGRDLFYELVVTVPDVVYVDTDGSTFDAALGLFPGTCTGQGAMLGCANDPCAPATFGQLARSVAPGTYCLVVDEGGPSAGNSLVLDVYFAGRSGKELTGPSPHVVTGDTCTATDVVDPTCENLATNPGTAKDQLYWFPVCAGSQVTASTCTAVGFDSIVSHGGRTATPFCADDGCVGGGDGSETIGGYNPVPGLIRVIVDGWNGACGTYTLTVTH